LRPLKEGGVRLTIRGPDGSPDIKHPTVIATWDLTEAAKDAIKKHSGFYEAIYVLFVYWPLGDFLSSAEQRKLVALDSPMTDIPLVSSGKNRIMALVVGDASYKALRDKYLTHQYGRYKNTVVTFDNCGTHLAPIAAGCVDITLTSELFAERPSGWSEVNELFESQAANQCSYRARWIFRYFVMPPLVLGLSVVVWLLATFAWCGSLVMVLAMLMLGARGINYRPLWYPMNDGPKEVLRGIYGSKFIPVVKGYHVPFFMVFSPFVWAVAGTVAWTATQAFPGMSWWVAFAYAMLWATSILALVTVIALIAQTPRRIPTVGVKAQERLTREANVRRREARVNALLKKASAPRPTSVWRQPPTWRAVRMYLVVVKSWLCRPFSS
jgi:hypothetical protein